MPFIDSKITVALTDEKKETIKSELGNMIAVLHKPESYLMIGIQDKYDLWFAGEKLSKGAYVAVSLFGNAPAATYEKFTANVCALFEKELDIPASSVYVTYHPVSDWGWNGVNF